MVQPLTLLTLGIRPLQRLLVSYQPPHGIFVNLMLTHNVKIAHEILVFV